jgi:hypothetical protein
MPSVRADSPLATPEGWLRAGELRPGDEVFAADGKTTVVTAVSFEAVTEAMSAKMVLDPVVVSMDHDLVLGLPWYGKWIGPMELMTERQRRLIEPLAPTRRIVLDLPDIDLPLDPWTYGYWRVLELPDGVIAVPASLIERATTHLEAVGLLVSQMFIDRDLAYITSPGLAVALRNMGDRPGFLPIYLRAGAKQRQELLSGIFDARGQFMNGVTVQASQEIVQAAAELAMSLGLRASIPGGTAPRVRMSPHDTVMMLRCEALSEFLHGPDRPGFRTEVPYMIRKGKPMRGGDFVVIKTEAGTYLLGRAMLPARDH